MSIYEVTRMLHRSTVIAAVILASVVFLGGTSSANGPPAVPVCGPCGTQFENAAATHEINLTVTRSTATVQIHSNGSATWTVTNRIRNESTASRLRDHPAVLDDIARTAVHSSDGLPIRHDDSTAADTPSEAHITDGRTVVVTVSDPDAAPRRLDIIPGFSGVLVVEYLHNGATVGHWAFNADRFTVVGPPGTAISNDPGTAEDTNVRPSVEDRRMTWHGSSTGEITDVPSDFTNVYVAFASEGTPQWVTTLALALATAPTAMSALTLFVLPETIVFGLMTLAVMGTIARLRDESRTVSPPRTAAVIIAVGGVATFVFFLGVRPDYLAEWLTFGPPELLALLAAGGIVGGGITLRASPREVLDRPGRQAVTALGVLVVFGALLTVLRLGPDMKVVAALTAAITPLLWVAPIVAFFPLGGAIAGNRRQRLAWFGIAVGVYMFVPLTIVDLGRIPTGMGAIGIMFVVVTLAGWAIVAAMIGTPVLLLGYELAKGGES